MHGLWRRPFVQLLLPLLLLHAFGAPGVLAQDAPSDGGSEASVVPADCHCGFLDPNTSHVYTDSIIVYFNETTTIPAEAFSVADFEHPYEKGWTISYREGAAKQNAYFENGTVWNLEPGWLNLNVSGYTPQHLVNGAQLQTVRQDIQYGTFRAFMRSPQPYAGGSALTMRLQYNRTSTAELDLLNMDDSSDNACMQTSTGGDVPVTSWGVNYTTLEGPDHKMGPWDFWEWRMDWDRDNISWFVSDWKTRSVPTSNASLVDIPTAFSLKHWSNGDTAFMQGPPQNNSAASVGYVRLFFNTSTPSTSQAGSAACDASMLCSTDNVTLRMTTKYAANATERWKPPADASSSRSRGVGIALMIASLAFSAALVIHAVLRKVADGKAARRSTGGPGGASLRPKVLTSPWPSSDHLSRNRSGPDAWTSQADFELSDLHRGRGATTALNTTPGSAYPGGGHKRERSISEHALLGYHDSTAASSTTAFGVHTPHALDTPGPSQRNSYFDGRPDGDMSIDTLTPRGWGPGTPADASTTNLLNRSAVTPAMTPAPIPEGSVAAANPGAKPPPAPAALPQQRTRIDYLAGLVAVCSLLVSCEHFILTYVPSVVMETLPQHYRSEYWARRTIEPFVFNEVWVGLFFTTSTRFLTSGFLRSGNLKIVAEKVVCRTPRLMIPIAAIILLEYFLMDVGAVKFLEYIPSISWSTWPSTSVYPNFGYFIDETLQLFYLIPNAAPQITWNYCTGVLWTIPVQLQNSWLVLLGVVVVREIKTPWKRFGYYAFCIITHWYAMSWGSYFWFGLMLADLDITYKYRKFIQARWWVHYPMLITVIVIVLLSLANDLFSVWTGYTFSTEERGIHPEIESAQPLAQTSEAGYPEYTEPKLNGLLFAVGSQYIVELSTWVQAVLSTRVFLWLFPHVFTIYLIHGLVWWSMGSLVCVFFAGQGLAYWLNMLLTCTICYATLFAALPIVTPVMEMLGKEVTKSIWIGASEEPAPWRPGSFPFSIEEIQTMVFRRDDEDIEGSNRPTRLRDG